MLISTGLDIDSINLLDAIAESRTDLPKDPKGHSNLSPMEDNAYHTGISLMNLHELELPYCVWHHALVNQINIRKQI